jgi:hypothetical protein
MYLLYQRALQNLNHSARYEGIYMAEDKPGRKGGSSQGEREDQAREKGRTATGRSIVMLCAVHHVHLLSTPSDNNISLPRSLYTPLFLSLLSLPLTSTTRHLPPCFPPLALIRMPWHSFAPRGRASPIVFTQLPDARSIATSWNPCLEPGAGK